MFVIIILSWIFTILLLSGHGKFLVLEGNEFLGRYYEEDKIKKICRKIGLAVLFGFTILATVIFALTTGNGSKEVINNLILFTSLWSSFCFLVLTFALIKDKTEKKLTY